MWWSESAFNFPQIPPCELWDTSSKLPYKDGRAESQRYSFTWLSKNGKCCQGRGARVQTLSYFLKMWQKNNVLWHHSHERKYLFLKVALKWLPLTLLFAPITQHIAEKWKLLCWHWHEMSWLLQTKEFLWSPRTVNSHTFLWSISVQCCFNNIHRWKTTQKVFSHGWNYLLLIKDSLTPRLFWIYYTFTNVDKRD